MSDASESNASGSDTSHQDQPVRHIAPPPFLADPAFAALLAALPQARVIGGAVRDALAGHPIADVDLATPLPPADVMAALQRAGIRAVPTGLAHGTVTAMLGTAVPGTAGRATTPLGRATGATPSVEITTLRRDVATDGRHAIVAFTDDWREDAARRDFTINAISMTPTGAVYDYFGGIADLHAGVLRFVGDPAHRIAEDYLRLLRYFRFFARYAARPPEPSVRTALQAGIPGLATLSAERVWNELRRILAAADPRAAVRLMADLGVLAAVIPEGTDPAALEQLIEAEAPPATRVDPLLRLAALLTGDVERVADRLRWSAAERQRLMEMRTTPLARPDDGDDTLRRLLADHDRRALIDRTWLELAGPGPAEPIRLGYHPAGQAPTGPPPATTAADNPTGAKTGTTDARWTALRTRLASLPQPVFPLEGRDVLALGVSPGPQVGALLRATRAWWLAGGCVAGLEACRAELARAVSRITAPAAENKENPRTSGQTER